MATKPRRAMAIVHSWDEAALASEAEESAFWGDLELDDVLLRQMTGDADQALPPPRPRTKPVALRFDEETLRRAKMLASRRGKGYQTLLKEFITERLYEEEKREGLVGAGLVESTGTEYRRGPSTASTSRSRATRKPSGKSDERRRPEES